MTSDDFPADVGQFIAENVSSVAQLEILLLLRGGADRVWTTAEVSAALQLTPDMAAEQMAELQRRGLISRNLPADPYRYSPRTPELAGLVDRLARLYDERRVSVITQIYSKPVDKVQTFADAFRWRKET